MPADGQRLDRSGADRVHPDPVPAQIGGQVAHRRLQRRLRHAHHVVVRRPALGADIGQRQQAAARPHHRHRALRDRGERVAGDVQRLQERLARRVEVAAAQIRLVGEADRVDQEIQPVPLLAQRREGGVDAGLVAHVAGNSRSEPTDAASGRTRRSSASPWKVNASSAPCAAQAAAMPQPSERSLATPMIRPRLPCISVPLQWRRCRALADPLRVCCGGGTACRRGARARRSTAWRAGSAAAECTRLRERPIDARCRSARHRSVRQIPGMDGRGRAHEPEDANAMTLATATPDGTPSARIVLLKGADAAGLRVLHQQGEPQGRGTGRQRARRAAVPLEVAGPPGPHRGPGRARRRRRGRRLLRHATAHLASRAPGRRTSRASCRIARNWSAGLPRTRRGIRATISRARRTGPATAMIPAAVRVLAEHAVPAARPHGLHESAGRRLDDRQAVPLTRR